MHRIRHKRALFGAGCIFCSAIAGAPALTHAAMPAVEELKRLSIEELGNIEITSVSKRAEPLSKAPASVYVITNEDIRRSGAPNLPEALRLAPNLVVGRSDGGNYAITARGFNDFSTGNRTSNKLLVLIDGRSVYTALHGGVFWGEDQVMLEDIDRIEVISGPGGTLWGANAVNGVINVITKSSKDTQDGLASVRYGTRDRVANARYGAKIDQDTTFRVYGQGYDFGPTEAPNNTSFNDGYHGVQTGFRTDMAGGENTATVQGDIYRNPLDGNGQFNGGNLLGRFAHTFERGSVAEVQAYFTRAERRDPSAADSSDTYDIQLQHTFTPHVAHEVVWGGGVRVYDNEFVGTSLTFNDPKDTSQLSNVFGQDTISLLEDLKLTLGTKFEYSDMTGLEYLPSARLAWEVSDSMMLWSAVSRSVRAPTRAEREFVIPGVLVESPDFTSEKVVSYELGARGTPFADTTASLTLYYNRYDDLRTIERVGAAATPVFQANRMEGDTYGIEAWGDHAILPWWRLSAGANMLEKNLTLESGSTASDRPAAGNDPSFTYSLRSRMDLVSDIEFDIGLRKIDSLPNPRVDGYYALDFRVGRKIANNLELSLSGFNLLDDQHPETGTTGTPREVRRSVIAGARMNF